MQIYIIVLKERRIALKRIIKVRNISKKIGKKKILDNISFDVYEGEIVGLVGPNGAGKSTLLKIMTGLYSMDEGEVYYYDINLKTDFEKAMSMVGTLIESPDMYKSLSGKKNLEIFIICLLFKYLRINQL